MKKLVTAFLICISCAAYVYNSDFEKTQMAKMENGFKKRLYDTIDRARSKRLELFDDAILNVERAIAKIERDALHLNTLNNARAGARKAEFDARRADVDAQLTDDIMNKRGDRRVLEARAAVEKSKIEDERQVYNATVETANAANLRGAARKVLEETNKLVETRNDKLEYITAQLEKEKTRLAAAEFVLLGGVPCERHVPGWEPGRIKANIKKLEDLLDGERMKADSEAVHRAEKTLANANALFNEAKAWQSVLNERLKENSEDAA